MADPQLILVHSPLVGPLTWWGVAEALGARGFGAAVPSLLPADGVEDSWRPKAEAVKRAADEVPTGASVVLVGHSAAGLLLPAAGAALAAYGRTVAAYIFVDAPLPAPGSWFDSAPPELAETLRALAGPDGRLPRWSDWWPPEVMLQLLPDAALRERFCDELPRVPLALFEEPLPHVAGWPDAPCGYVQLSEAYAGEAAEAERRGWPVEHVETDHLAIMTRAGEVAEALLALVGSVGPPP